MAERTLTVSDAVEPHSYPVPVEPHPGAASVESILEHLPVMFLKPAINRAAAISFFLNDVKSLINDAKGLDRNDRNSYLTIGNDALRTLNDIRSVPEEFKELPFFKQLGKGNPWLAIGNDVDDLTLKLTSKIFAARPSGRHCGWALGVFRSSMRARARSGAKAGQIVIDFISENMANEGPSDYP